MFEWNLNLIFTFFWLFLSAGILLPGIWLLIDCKINHSIINIILEKFYFYNKLKNDISKLYFLHFYIICLIINIILFIYHFSSFLLFIIFILDLLRRLYECISIYKFNRKLKRNFLYDFFGLIHYLCVGLTIIIDYKYSYTNITFLRYFFALILFFNVSYIQYNVHLILAKMNSYQNNNDYWIFNYLSYPNYITEIFIYISFFIASHRTSSMASLIVWVFINQSLSALLNHRWYYQHYKELYPSKRYALIPFIL